jgi:hypothetical protein
MAFWKSSELVLTALLTLLMFFEDVQCGAMRTPRMLAVDEAKLQRQRRPLREDFKLNALERVVFTAGTQRVQFRFSLPRPDGREVERSRDLERRECDPTLKKEAQC